MNDKNINYVKPEIEIIDVAKLDKITALAGSCVSHCGGRR